MPRWSSCWASVDSPMAEATESPIIVARTGPVGVLSLAAVAGAVVPGGGSTPTGGGGPRLSVAPVWLGSAARIGVPPPPLPPPHPARRPATARTARARHHLSAPRSTGRDGTEPCGGSP